MTLCLFVCVQEQAAESENEANENMGRVDEGVEEFFTKKIIPDDPLWVHNTYKHTQVCRSMLFKQIFNFNHSTWLNHDI